MSSRRAGLPAPSSVIVEFHEFSGRWFVTDRWGSGHGSAIPPRARKAALGKAVLDQAGAARSRWHSARSEADGAELWARFTEEAAGVPVDRYQPEKRLVILAGTTGIQCCDARQSPPRWEPLPARSPRALGAALIKRIGLLEPSPSAPGQPEPGAGSALPPSLRPSRAAAPAMGAAGDQTRAGWPTGPEKSSPWQATATGESQPLTSHSDLQATVPIKSQ